MSDFPWVPFYPSDWLAGTRGMSAAETGIYITLIALMYERQKPIKEDVGRLARVCGASNSAFSKAIDLLVDEGKIERVDGLLWNNRVGREVKKRSEKSEVASQSAKRRWDNPDGKDQQKQQPENANAEQTQCKRNANQKPDTRSQKDKKDIRRSKPTYTKEFEDFWVEWKFRKGESKELASKQWLRLSPEDRKRAFGSAAPYTKSCKSLEFRKHCDRYLRDRLFDGFEPQAPPKNLIEVLPDTDEHDAWSKHYRDKGKPWMVKPGTMMVPTLTPPQG